MIGSEVVFILILALPMIGALILLKMTYSSPVSTGGSVHATYWGTYTDVPKKANPRHAQIKLHDVATEDPFANPHMVHPAVHFHP